MQKNSYIAKENNERNKLKNLKNDLMYSLCKSLNGEIFKITFISFKSKFLFDKFHLMNDLILNREELYFNSRKLIGGSFNLIQSFSSMIEIEKNKSEPEEHFI